MSDLTSYTWNEVTTAKATRLADLPESYPVGTLTVKHSEGEVSYDGSEDVSIDLTHIQQSINTLKDTMSTYYLLNKISLLVELTLRRLMVSQYSVMEIYLYLLILQLLDIRGL